LLPIFDFEIEMKVKSKKAKFKSQKEPRMFALTSE